MSYTSTERSRATRNRQRIEEFYATLPAYRQPGCGQQLAGWGGAKRCGDHYAGDMPLRCAGCVKRAEVRS